MKILLTCDPEIPVPPVLYGGIERIVDGLAKGYSEAGHQVYLVANPASTCRHTIENFSWPALHSRGVKNIWLNALFLHSVAGKVKPDAVHSFSRLMYGYPIFAGRNTPFLQSYQRRISPGSTRLALKIAGRKLHFTACAAHMLKDLPHPERFTPVFNFTNTAYFDLDRDTTREHLLFLGRIEDIKGTREAIEAALLSNEKIIVAGNIQPGHEDYFETSIRPFLSNPLVQYVGPVNDEQKKMYLQKARALLFPIKWEEPFGIVLAEALSCGTPVIGFNRGSVPEVVTNGKNGVIVDSMEEMANSIRQINSLNNCAIRSDATKRFSLQNITAQYISVIQNAF